MAALFDLLVLITSGGIGQLLLQELVEDEHARRPLGGGGRVRTSKSANGWHQEERSVTYHARLLLITIKSCQRVNGTPVPNTQY